MELNKLTLAQAQKGLSKKEFTSRELTQACIKAIEEQEDSLNAFIRVTARKALEQAGRCDKLLKRGGNLSPLFGVPTAVKDNIVTKDLPTTAGSKILEEYNPQYDATVVRKLSEAGAVILGKTNMDEFAMGASTEYSAFGATKNPWDLTRVPGGSSGGSACAVASDMAIYALGSDTGGSVRQPASFCSVVGLRPTYGRVSRYGLIAMASSLDQIGTITKTVEDAAIVLNVISGRDLFDATSFETREDFRKALTAEIKGVRIGVPKEYFGEGLSKDVKEKVLGAIKVLEENGAKISQVSLPSSGYALAAYYIIVPSEVSSNLARFDGVKYGLRKRGENLLQTYIKTRSFGFGDEVRRRIMLGTFTLSSGYWDAYYLNAAKARTLIAKEFDKVFKKVDVLITPTTPTTAFKLGEVQNPLEMYMADIYTVTAPLAGIPALSVPFGEVEGLPVGVQLMGPKFSEKLLLNLGGVLETANG